MPPSAMTGTSSGAAHRVHDGGDLGNAHAGHDARGADAARPDADLHRVDARAAPSRARPPRWRRCRRRAARRGRPRAAGVTRPRARPRCARARSRRPARPRRRRPARARAPVASEPPPTAAATRSRPCWSLLALGCSRRLKMSLTVMRPLSTPLASTTGSFSIRCCARIRSASSRLVPTGAVTRLVLRHRLADRLVEVALELEIAVGDDADRAGPVRPRSARPRS